MSPLNEQLPTRKFKMYQAMSQNRHSVSHDFSKKILQEIKDRESQRIPV